MELGNFSNIVSMMTCVAVVLALLYSFWNIKYINSLNMGDDAMKRVAGAIYQGAVAYLTRQYSYILVVGIVISILLLMALSVYHAIGFVVGAVLSGATGYIGMHVSVRANVRTAQAARSGLSGALNIAFKGGAVTGFLVVGLGLFGVGSYYLLLKCMNVGLRMIMESLISLGFGASLISIFARLGGGIFTKGADVGADLVGKIEASIPEDDPRNPAVIADNVGDNVGDCAGMAADLFETYVVTIVATMFLASNITFSTHMEYAILFPIAIGAICIFGSIVGTFFVNTNHPSKIMKALYKCIFVGAATSILLIFAFSHFMMPKMMIIESHHVLVNDLFLCAIVGMVLTAIMVMVTEYYTATKYRPVKQVAQASQTGHATNIIEGLALSMEATVFPAIFIVAAIITCYKLGGLYGIAISATSMLALAGVVVALDAYGPITDNAGGIAEMSGMPTEVRKVTDALDAVGNTTKAVTKGYAIASAGLAAIILFAAYIEDLEHFFKELKITFDLQDPYVVSGLILGGVLPYWFSSLGLRSVSRAGSAVVEEVRKQFKENPEIMEGTQKPNYKSTVDILTTKAIREMVLPSLLPVLVPVAIWTAVFYVDGLASAFKTLGALLMGIIVTGLFIAISMTAGGGAWDNAKKLIEDGNYGGKNSDSHRASITGDTVGDPYKDTVGPAINPMIKVANIVALLLLVCVSKLDLLIS